MWKRALVVRKPCTGHSMCIFTWLSMLVEGWSELAGMSWGAHKANARRRYGPTKSLNAQRGESRKCETERRDWIKIKEWDHLRGCLVSTDVTCKMMMLTWISLAHPWKISGLQAWQRNDCLGTARQPHRQRFVFLTDTKNNTQLSGTRLFQMSPVWTRWLFITSVSAVSRPICPSDRMHLHKACSLCGRCAFNHDTSAPLLFTVFTHALQTDEKDVKFPRSLRAAFGCLGYLRWSSGVCKELTELTAVCWPLRGQEHFRWP